KLLPLPRPPIRPRTGLRRTALAGNLGLDIFHIQPVRPCGHIYFQAYLALKGLSHLLLPPPPYFLQFITRAFAHPLLVDRQQHACLALLVLEPAIDVQHRELQEVGRGTLDSHVDRFALGLVALRIMRIFEYAGDRPTPAKDRADIADLPAVLQELGLVFQ